MRALVLSIRVPFFSIKLPEAYQVAASYDYLMPSTLFGALCASLCVLNGWKEEECKEKLKGTKVRELYPKRVVLASKFPVILRRVRGVLEERRLPSSLDEATGFFDAMVREYVFTLDERKAIVLTSRLDEVKEAAWLISRAGDSESLLSVTSVEEVELEECGGGEITVMSKMGSGGVTVRGFDEEGVKSDFLVPARAHPLYLYYRPVTYSGKALCKGDIRVPAGTDW